MPASRVPPRPHVPASLHCLAAVVVVQALALMGHVALACVVMATAGAVAALSRARRGCERGVVRLPLVIAACVATALASSLVAGWRVECSSRVLADAPVGRRSLVVETDGSQTMAGWLQQARFADGPAAGARVWLRSDERVPLGYVTSGLCRFERLEDDDWGRSSRARGLAGSVRLLRAESLEGPGGLMGALCSLRTRLRDWLLADGDMAAALLAATVTADDVAMDGLGGTELFSRCGLSHLVAVSGGHLVIVAWVIERLARLVGAGPRARCAVALAPCAAYVALCGMPASAVRSWLMLACSWAGRLGGRRSHACSAASLAGLAMCLADPFAATDVGLRLSMLSVVALCVFMPLVSVCVGRARLPLPRRTPAIVRRGVAPAVSGALETLGASLVCQVATLSCVAATFGEVSLVAPVANVVVAPLFAPVVALGMVSCALLPVPLLAQLPRTVALGLCELAVRAAALLSRMPLASVPLEAPMALELLPIVVGVLALAAWPLLTPRRIVRSLAAALACALVVAVAPMAAGPRVVILDVGQGDAILVRDHGRSVLVDAGVAGSVRPALARQGVWHLDAVVITHLHDDHYGGLSDLLASGMVGCVIVGRGVSDDLERLMGEQLTGSGATVGELSSGDSLSIGGFLLECLWPRGATDGSENDDSLCLRVSYDSGDESLTALLCGDAEQGVLGEVAGDVGDIDLLKVGHHGSAQSISLEQAAALDPEVSVASAGESNRYGHPTEECVETLEKAGSTFLCTIDAGDVTVRPGRDGPRVSTATRVGEIA